MGAQCLALRSLVLRFAQKTLCDDRYLESRSRAGPGVRFFFGRRKRDRTARPFASTSGVSICLKWFASKWSPVTRQRNGYCADNGGDLDESETTSARRQSAARRSTMWPWTAPSRAITASTSHGNAKNSSRSGYMSSAKSASSSMNAFASCCLSGELYACARRHLAAASRPPKATRLAAASAVPPHAARRDPGKRPRARADGRLVDAGDARERRARRDQRAGRPVRRRVDLGTRSGKSPKKNSPRRSGACTLHAAPKEGRISKAPRGFGGRPGARTQTRVFRASEKSTPSDRYHQIQCARSAGSSPATNAKNATRFRSAAGSRRGGAVAGQLAPRRESQGDPISWYSSKAPAPSTHQNQPARRRMAGGSQIFCASLSTSGLPAVVASGACLRRSRAQPSDVARGRFSASPERVKRRLSGTSSRQPA